MHIFHSDACAWCPSACNPQPVMTVRSLRACFAVYLSFLSSWNLGKKKDTPVLQPRCFDQDVLQQWGSDSQGTEKITTPVSADNEHTRTERRQGSSQHFSQQGEDLYKAPPSSMHSGRDGWTGLIKMVIRWAKLPTLQLSRNEARLSAMPPPSGRVGGPRDVWFPGRGLNRCTNSISALLARWIKVLSLIWDWWFCQRSKNISRDQWGDRALLL